MDNIHISYTLDNIIYELNVKGEALVVGNTIERIGDVDIPDKVLYIDKEYTVVAIGRASFKGNQYIEYVTLPSTIKIVQEDAFRESSIKFLDFTQIVALHDVKIEKGMCYECMMLESVHLASGILELPDFAFYKAIRLNEINTPHRLQRIGDSVFEKCESLMHFDFTNDITEIGNKAFLGTNITYAEIGYRVNLVGNQAFKSINLSTLVVFNEKAELGEDVISGERRVTVYVKGNEMSKNALYVIFKISSIHYVVIDDFTLLEKSGIKYLTFEQNVARVVGYNDTELEENTVIKDSIAGSPVTDFQPRAFAYSKKLMSCIFPRSIKRIKGKVFEGCRNLKRVIFQNPISQKEAEWVVYNENADIIIE